ncbi:hypothetical protein OsJ_30793 [Oryza sativa Japonica Group]|uniref:Uncharacterized protein n=1 Tax=Oryza sativa subsp. japonica TaxID=39947 RepID=B9G7M0_ORYSJ|nr:hypothetical protein OsJ_30793 [Oryza sativa Japonica Group]
MPRELGAGSRVGSGTSSLGAPPITSKTLAPYPAAPMASASAGGMAANAPDWRSTKPLPPRLPHPPPSQAVAVAGHAIADYAAGLSSRRHRAATAGSGVEDGRLPLPQAVAVAGRRRRRPRPPLPQSVAIAGYRRKPEPIAARRPHASPSPDSPPEPPRLRAVAGCASPPLLLIPELPLPEPHADTATTRRRPPVGVGGD